LTYRVYNPAITIEAEATLNNVSPPEKKNYIVSISYNNNGSTSHKDDQILSILYK
jgi:hypothetical protein